MDEVDLEKWFPDIVSISETLYSIISPFLSDSGGGFQLRETVVGLVTFTARLVGGPEGAMCIYIYIYIYIYMTCIHMENSKSV